MLSSEDKKEAKPTEKGISLKTESKSFLFKKKWPQS